MKWNEVDESSITCSKYFSIARQIITIRSLVKSYCKNQKFKSSFLKKT